MISKSYPNKHIPTVRIKTFDQKSKKMFIGIWHNWCDVCERQNDPENRIF